MASKNYQKKEKKKRKKVKGNGYSKVPVGRTYPGSIMPFPDLPGTSRGV